MFVWACFLSLALHLTQEGQDCENYGGDGVGYDPRKIRPDIRKVSCADGLLDSHRMAERQQLGRRFERAAYKLKVKPYAGQPCGEVRQQRTAYAASRPRKNAVTKHTAACPRAMGSSGKV